MTRPEHFELLIESAKPPDVPDSHLAEPGYLLAHANLPEIASLLAIVLRLAAESPQPWCPRTMQEWLT